MMACWYVDVDMGYMDVNEDKGDGDVLNNSLKPEVGWWSSIEDEEDEGAAVALVVSWRQVFEQDKAIITCTQYGGWEDSEEAAPNWLRQTKRILPFRNVFCLWCLVKAIFSL